MPSGIGAVPVLFDAVARAVSDHVGKMDPRQQGFEPAQDTNQQGVVHSQALGNPVVLKYGRVISAIPYLHWYVVSCSDQYGLIPCCMLDSHGQNALGVKSTHLLQNGTDVWVIIPPHALYGYIAGAMPPIMSDSSLIFADYISQGSGCGFRKEDYYKQQPDLLAEGEGGMLNFNGGRPMDGTGLGEWGKITETGMAFHLDSAMAFIRATEMCGVWAFQRDEFLRIAGRNLDFRTGGHEITARDDEGEFQYHHGDTGYPWESAGALAYGVTAFRTTEDADVVDSAIEAKYEPLNDDQTPFYRYQEYGGYLGQGRQRLVVAPPRQTGTWRYSDQDALQGLFSEHIGYDGMYGLQTAKGFSLLKRPSIVIPKRLLPAEAGQPDDSDNASNYKAASQYGEGPDHKIGDIQNVTEYPQIMSVAAVLDLHAYHFNWKRLHPFYYHKKDFATPDETALPAMSQQQAAIDFSQIQSQMWLDRPTPVTSHIDHRYGDVQYFQNTAGITVTDDGGVVIFDGYGSAITLAGGNITIAPTGSLLLQPGKSLVALAGDDVCLRAQNSVDLSAGGKDVRIKAEQNMQLLAGNSGQGGMLFDCRSEGTDQSYEGEIGEDVESSGIVFKASQSVIATISQSLYLHTTESDIVLDSNQGQANVILVGEDILNYAQGAIVHYFGYDTVEAANVFESGSTLLNGELAVGSSLAVSGGAEFGDSVASLGSFGSKSSEFVGVFDASTASQIQDSLDQIGTDQTDAVQEGQTVHDDDLATTYYEDSQLGDPGFLEQLQFSFRNEKQYGTSTKFVLPSTYWQQLAASAGAGSAWQEPPVQYQGEPLLPWPGQSNWKENSTFYATTLNLYDLSGGVDESRADPAYEAPQYGPWQTQTPDSAYLTLPAS